MVGGFAGSARPELDGCRGVPVFLALVGLLGFEDDTNELFVEEAE
jgi:hypothetical protein